MGEAAAPRQAESRGRTGRPPLSERRREVVRWEIARAAMRLFTEKGVAHTSAAEIAESVGVSVRTLWRYFPSKEECVAPLFVSGAERLARALREWPQGMSLVEAIGQAHSLHSMDAERLVFMRSVMRLMRNEPALQTVWLRTSYEQHEMVAHAIAVHEGKESTDLETRVQAGMLLSATQLAFEEYAQRVSPDDPAPEPQFLGELLRKAVQTAVDGLPF